MFSGPIGQDWTTVHTPTESRTWNLIIDDEVLKLENLIISPHQTLQLRRRAVKILHHLRPLRICAVGSGSGSDPVRFGWETPPPPLLPREKKGTGKKQKKRVVIAPSDFALAYQLTTQPPPFSSSPSASLVLVALRYRQVDLVERRESVCSSSWNRRERSVVIHSLDSHADLIARPCIPRAPANKLCCSILTSPNFFFPAAAQRHATKLTTINDPFFTPSTPLPDRSPSGTDSCL